MSQENLNRPKGWSTVKYEEETDMNGTVVKVVRTMEPQKKKFLGADPDIILRTVGILAIFIPILLFYLNKVEENRSKKNDIQADLYSKTKTLLHRYLETPLSRGDSLRIEDSLMNDLHLLLKLKGSKDVAARYGLLRKQISILIYAKRIGYALDSFRNSTFLYKPFGVKSSSVSDGNGDKIYAPIDSRIPWNNWKLNRVANEFNTMFHDEFAIASKIDSVNRDSTQQMIVSQSKILDSSLFYAAAFSDYFESAADTHKDSLEQFVSTMWSNIEIQQPLVNLSYNHRAKAENFRLTVLNTVRTLDSIMIASID